ncbi:Serine aminopeptidase S33 domain-containing protein [Tumidithrix helvetica PCC 7403]|uniref:alpha/beta hydrolase n=1 Tax=Tumidithrix helvetica TaxID=3457545 RepID=UPI003CAE7F9D
MASVQTWKEYYQQHLKINPNLVRDGCEPRIMLHEESQEHTIVLLHGLTDSPYFMEAIGKQFYDMGFNVLIPLLTGHGLRNPQGMKGVTLEQWIDNVDFAVKKARGMSPKVSIGGLSTGGALSVYKAVTAPKEITGGVFLFSAALELASGEITETLLRTKVILPLLAFVEDLKDKSLVGDNPYRYDRMDKHGAAKLSELIEKTDRLIKGEQHKGLTQPLFIAHSEDDTAAKIEGVEDLYAKEPPDKREFFRIPKQRQVSHASVVLEADIKASDGRVLEQKNPLFSEMMDRVCEFSRTHLVIEPISLIA